MPLNFILRIAFILLFFAVNAQAEDKFRYPFYFGVGAGYGATTWKQLVSNNQTAAMTLSTPIATNEGGTVFNIFGGYEVIPAFAIEASYLHYPSTKVIFDEMSLFAFDHGSTELTTRTETLSLSGKFMVVIPRTTIRAYSSVGAAGVHRDDYVDNTWILAASFGAGFNYNVTEHVMLELGANYATGSGQAELDPAEHYVPFTYAVFARTAYRF